MKVVEINIRKVNIAIFILFLFLFATSSLCTATSVNYGAINQIEICVEATGYKDFVPHYQFERGEIPHFHPGSTVYIYVEATGKTRIDPDTCEYIPDITFSLTGTKPRGDIEFSTDTTSTELVNNDLTLSKETYGILSIRPCCIGKYTFKIEARDNNMGGRRVGLAPLLHFYVSKDAYLYPPEHYVLYNLSIKPNHANEGDSVTVNISVKNEGGKGREEGKDVNLYFNGSEVESEKVILGHGEETTLAFKLEDVKAGEWLIEADGITATLFVMPPLPSPSPSPSPSSPLPSPSPPADGTRKIATAVIISLIIVALILFAYTFFSKS